MRIDPIMSKGHPASPNEGARMVTYFLMYHIYLVPTRPRKTTPTTFSKIPPPYLLTTLMRHLSIWVER